MNKEDLLDKAINHIEKAIEGDIPPRGHIMVALAFLQLWIDLPEIDW